MSLLNDELGSEPVNLQAAVLLFKSPWWAFAPPEVRKVLERKEIKITAYLSVTRDPPPHVPNRIGERVQQVTVIGYSRRADAGPDCDAVKRFRQEGKMSGVRSSKGGDKLSFGLRFKPRQYNQIWFVMFDCGHVQEVTGKTLNRWTKMDPLDWNRIHNQEDFVINPIEIKFE